MFFGRVISNQDSFLYSAQTVDETVGDVICISNAALAPNSKDEAILIVKKDGNEHVVATLNQKCPQVALNFFVEISEHAEFVVRGSGSVHVIGFFQPQPKFDPLDQVQLLHKHEHQLQHGHESEEHIHSLVHKSDNEAKKQVPKPQEKKQSHAVVNQKQEKKMEKKEINKDKKEQKKIQDSSEDQQMEYEDEQDSENVQEQQGSPLKGLQDIDDDIGHSSKPVKTKPHLNSVYDQSQKKAQPIAQNQQKNAKQQIPQKKPQNNQVPQSKGQIQQTSSSKLNPSHNVNTNKPVNTLKPMVNNPEVAESKKDKKKKKKKNKNKFNNSNTTSGATQ